MTIKKRLVIPKVNLKKFYQICVKKDPYDLAGKLKLSKRTLESYVKFRDLLFNGRVSALGFEEFLEKMKHSLVELIGGEQLLKSLSNDRTYLNSATLKNKLKESGFKISMSSAENLISLLVNLGAVYPVRVFYYTPSLSEQVLGFIADKGAVKVIDIKKKFEGNPRIYDALLELWSKNLVEIPSLDVSREIYLEYGRTGIPAELAAPFKSVNFYVDRRTGKKVAEIILDDKAKVIYNGR